MAKHIVAAGIAERCTVQVSYAIGRAEPTSFYVQTHGTGKTDDETIEQSIRGLFNLSPNGIIKTLGLKSPIYSQTAAYGHFGKEGLPWEKMDSNIISALKKI